MIERINPALRNKAIEYWSDFQFIFKTLYPNSEERDLLDIIETINTAYLNRKDALKEIDKKRELVKDWHLDQKWVATMLYVDLYAGNIKEMENHLTYLRELGINYVHLMPLLEPREGQADGGYAVKNFRKVNAKLGSNDDLIALIDKMHAEDQIIAIDFVMNHTAKEHEWAQSILKGESRFKNYYYLYPNRSIPDQYEKTLPEVFPDFAPGNFTYQEEINQWVWTTFNEYQWDLNYSEPKVFNAMLGEMLFLANLGVDILRLDAVPFLWKKIGTNCQNQEEAVMLLVAYKYLIQLVAPGVLFKSEAIVAPNDIIRYLGAGGYEGKACEIGYNATLMNHLWHAIACENTMLLRTTLSKLPPIPPSSTWINYIRCHDDIGWGISDQNAADVGQNGHETRMFCSAFYTGQWKNSFAQGYNFQIDKSNGESRISGSTAALIGIQKSFIENKKEDLAHAINRFKLLHGVIFFLRGIPLVYAGDEIGHLNNFDYLKDTEKREDNRWLHRPFMDWNKAKLRNELGTVENVLFNIIANFSKRRKETQCLHGNAKETIISLKCNTIFCVEKSLKEENLLLVANFSCDFQLITKLELPEKWQGKSFKEVISSTSYLYQGDTLIIPPYGILWLKEKTEKVSHLKAYRLKMEVETIPGESVYFIENDSSASIGEKIRNITCYWVDDLGWHVDLNLVQGEWLSYHWVKMYGNTLIEKSKDFYYHAM
jgi:amylosucrase